MSKQTLDFWFDFLSPYAWVAWAQVGDFCVEHDLQLRPRPVVFAGLLDHWGQLGPAEIEPKRRFIFKDVWRKAAAANVPIKPPVGHPFNPVAALRVALPEVSGERQMEVVDVLFRAFWTNSESIHGAEAVAKVLNAAGLPGDEWVAKSADPTIKQALHAESAAARVAGVFGVPTLMLDDELFWGCDQFAVIAAQLRDGSAVPAEVDHWLDTVQPLATRR